MVEHIIDPSYHLPLWEGKRKFRVQDGKTGENACVSKNVPYFTLFFMVCNDGTSVHLRPGSHHGQYTGNRDDPVFLFRFFKTDIELFPGIIISIGGNGNSFGKIAARSAANGKDQVRLAVFGRFGAFPKLFSRWIRHDAGNFRNHLMVLF